MVRAVEQIEQDLANLEEMSALLATEIYGVYSKYLTVLGQAVRQQLIMASYRVCTQGYPDSFVKLPFSQRQKLQSNVRHLGEQAKEELLLHLEYSEDLTEMADEEETEQEETVFELLEASAQVPPIVPEELPGTLEKPEEEDDDTLETTDSSDDLPLKPEQLRQWQNQLEEAIAQTLQDISTDINNILQKRGIIPDKLPTAVFEAAAKVEASSELTAGSPNLMNLLMEIETEGEEEDSTITRIIAINLRLSEIEFADPTLTALRNKIRQLSGKTKTLGQKYHKKQRELAVAQAEAAWRSSWFEE
ncbi:hypothetical protein [Lyngbya aestuarii]|uniref:hypothetical protein n=1 Tax=Lyngbya aestuarii TaxID=118322 RepID=UPI00403DF2D5